MHHLFSCTNHPCNSDTRFSCDAVCSEGEWQEMLDHVHSDIVGLRDNRYDHVVHMVTAASGAEDFYQLENNSIRTEGIGLARERDAKAAQVVTT